MKQFLLALAGLVAGRGALQSRAVSISNPAGTAIVHSDTPADRRYLVIAERMAARPGAMMQVEAR